MSIETQDIASLQKAYRLCIPFLIIHYSLFIRSGVYPLALVAVGLGMW